MTEATLHFRETYGFNLDHTCDECKFLKGSSCEKMNIEGQACPKNLACFLFDSKENKK